MIPVLTWNNLYAINGISCCHQTFWKGLQLYGFTHDEKAHEKHHNEKNPHEEAV